MITLFTHGTDNSVLVGVASYFIIGAVVMKVKFQATGSDIIPNKMFWIALPGLIKVIHKNF